MMPWVQDLKSYELAHRCLKDLEPNIIL